MEQNRITKLQEFRENLRDSLRFRRSLILVESFDFQSVEDEIEKVSNEIDPDFPIEEWNLHSGREAFRKGGETSIPETLEEAIDSTSERKKKLLLLKDALPILRQEPGAVSLLKRFVFENENKEDRKRGIVLIIDTSHVFPEGMEKLFHRIVFPYPDKEDIKAHIKEGVATGVYKVRSRTFGQSEPFERLVNSLVGMQLFEIKNVIKFQMYKMERKNGVGEIDSETYKIFAEQKKQIVKNTGVLEVIDTNINLNQVCGLEFLKQYLCRKRAILREDVKREKYHIPAPKGILLVGSPGCGKTMAAKAIAADFDIPLLRLDVGRLMGMYVGQSEHNLAQAIAIAEAAQPCVLWIDEIEKAFAGAGGRDGSNSDITVRRMIGSFLTWLQERKSEVFVAATANSTDALPPELMRKGRLDETFYVTYPSVEERKQMFTYNLRNHQMGSQDDKTLAKLAERTEYFSGAEIEAVVLMAVEEYFIQKETEGTLPDVLVELNLVLDKSRKNEDTKKARKEEIKKYRDNKDGWQPASKE